MSDQENLVEIPEVSEEATEVISETDGMSDVEISECKELGLIPKEEEETIVEDKDKGVEEEETETEINTDPDNFEEMDTVLEKNEKKFHEKFTPNQKALYFKQKAFKGKLKDKVAENVALQKELDELKGISSSKSKLDKIKELLSKEGLTVEEINEVIDKKDAPVEQKEVSQEVVQAKIKQKQIFAEKIGNAKYDNFKDIVTLADEVAKSKPHQFKLIYNAFTDDSVDESAIVDIVVDVARLHPKYSELSGKKPEGKIDSRVEVNSKKKASSASIGSSKANRMVSESDLTEADVENLFENNRAAYNKLKPETIDRILGKT